MPFTVTVLTLFPDMFPGPLNHSLVGKALETGLWQLNTVNIRDFATDKYATVDDTPYGGGAGMVMRADILAAAIDNVNPAPDRWFYLSPRGPLFTQQKSAEILQSQHIGLLCGRYEGVDQRVLDAYGIEELSIGDYVLTGGEIAAYAVIDTCIRQIFGVLGNTHTLGEESFGTGDYAQLLEYPHFTRPENWRNMQVPEVLKTGDHGKINAWRLEQAENLTQNRRPDVWDRYRQSPGYLQRQETLARKRVRGQRQN